MKNLPLLSLLVAAAGCAAHDPVGPVRYANAPIVWKVNDRLPVEKTPEKSEFLRLLYHFDSYYIIGTQAMAFRRDQRAQGVNALDEVPDSTWFTNRIGKRAVAPEEITRGPGSGISPDKAFPWTIKSAKAGGKEAGYLVEDANGRKFLLKFDAEHAPEAQTGSDAVAARLLWAAGYNVAEDHVVYFREQDVKIAPDATMKVFGKDVPLTWKSLAAQLQHVASASDGSIRGLASMFIDGKPLGGAPRLGTRPGDPNDRIPHELRRDQRGMGPFLAWIAHNDIKEDNTLDSFVKDPKNPSIQYVMHYLVDFGSALGAQALTLRRPFLDFQYRFDPKEAGLSFVTLGIYKQPWEGRIEPHKRGVGLFAVDDFQPDEWKAQSPGQLPLRYADRIDKFWASKILMKFTRAHIQAAVDAGRYSDPDSVKYLVDTLIGRARKTARHWFQQVNPIDEFEVTGNRLCFTDLALSNGLLHQKTTFTLRAFDDNGNDTGYKREVVADGAGRACIEDLALVKEGARYTIYRIDTSRGMPGTLVHIAVEPTSKQPRVIGIYRL